MYYFNILQKECSNCTCSWSSVLVLLLFPSSSLLRFRFCTSFEATGALLPTVLGSVAAVDKTFRLVVCVLLEGFLVSGFMKIAFSVFDEAVFTVFAEGTVLFSSSVFPFTLLVSSVSSD